MLTKEPCIFSKEPCAHSKEPCIHSGELYREAMLSTSGVALRLLRNADKTAIYSLKTAMYLLKKSHVFTQKSHVLIQKSHVFTQKSRTGKQCRQHQQSTCGFFAMLTK